MTRSVFTEQYQYVRQFLATAREEAGLSQRALSAKLNMAPSFVGKYEQGERRLDIVEVLYLCKVLNKNPADLIDALSQMSSDDVIIGKR